MPAPLFPSSDKWRLLFFGDSITAGDGDVAHWGWPGRLGEMSNSLADAHGKRLVIYSLGIGGQLSTEVYERAARETPARLDQRKGGLVFMAGINDIQRSLQPKNTVPLQMETVAETTAKLLEPLLDYPVIMIEPAPVHPEMQRWGGPWGPKVNTFLDQFCAEQEKAAKACGLPYLRIRNELATSDRFLKALDDSDGLHPTADGYVCIAEEVMANPLWRRWLETIAERCPEQDT